MARSKSNSLPRSIWALGIVSLLMDVSSETVHGLLPVFLVSVLGASVTSVGVLEGISEATVLILKVFSGPMSDALGKRKPLVLLGYGMAALSKPMFALAGSVPVIYAARIFDRIGKGIRGAPRDALIADLTETSNRGRAFGLRQALDTVGAFVGPLLAIFFMRLTNNNYRTVFWLATIPAVLSVMTIIFYVREPENGTDGANQKKFQLKEIKKFKRAFWTVSITGGIFQLARFSEAFLILRAKDFGLGLAFAPAVLIAMNLIYSAAAYPIGVWSDRFPKGRLLVAGFAVLTVADLTLALAPNLTVVFAGIVLWGIHLALTQGTLAAMVADQAPADSRGTAYGFFNLFSAVALLLASAGAGILWDQAGASVTFFTASGISALGLLTYLLAR